MSVIRQVPTTKEWVILATERSKRHIAGFELGSGIFIITMLPEESAARMRSTLTTFT